MKGLAITLPVVAFAGIVYMIMDGMQRISEAWGPLAAMGIMIAVSIALFMAVIMAMVMAYTALILNSQAKMLASVVESNAVPATNLFKTATQMAMFAKSALRSAGSVPGSTLPDAWIVDALPGSGQKALPWPDETQQAALETKDRRDIFIAR